MPMDATRMDYRDNSFDITLDKGTYDALAVNLAYLYFSVEKIKIP